jgi:hypothetical protein
MILVMGRRLFRMLVLLLVLTLVLPLARFYQLRALDPHYVQQYHEPRGGALKVSADWEDDRREGFWGRFRYFLHEFYQNGL